MEIRMENRWKIWERKGRAGKNFLKHLADSPVYIRSHAAVVFGNVVNRCVYHWEDHTVASGRKIASLLHVVLFLRFSPPPDKKFSSPRFKPPKFSPHTSAHGNIYLYLVCVLPVNFFQSKNRGLNRSRRTIFRLDFEICKGIRTRRLA